MNCFWNIINTIDAGIIIREAAYDEDVASLNDDNASDERESDTVMSLIDGDKPDRHDDNDPDDDPPPRGGRPALRVVK